jgi:hypothetical protein
VVLGEPPFLEESRKLVETGKTLTPYFYLYSSSTKDSTYEAKAWELYLTIKKGETAKERYIASILGSRFKNRQVETL